MINTSLVPTPDIHTEQQWTIQKANQWYACHPWLVGANFIPSTAINQLECWQAETFDTNTIDRELGYAQGIGMNVMRVFLHYLLWEQDAQGFKKRINTYLTISAKHRIKTIFVLFDDCWHPESKLGDQPMPRHGVHNSAWLQCPGKTIHDDPSKWGPLEKYTKGIIEAFRNDERILLWDVYNEPGNSDYGSSSLPLLKKVLEWTRAAKPGQPVSVGLWNHDTELNDFFLQHSDVITFHSYNDSATLREEIRCLKAYGRPVICTEYMARTKNSIFTSHLPIMKEEKTGAINWGLVSGKTNTIFPYLSEEGCAQPFLWFHDIFHKDGSPFDPQETRLIKQLVNGESPRS